MEVMIVRSYFPDAVNGELYIGEELQCYTIELPWLNNEPQRSCIPEGNALRKRWSPKHKWHLQLMNVPNRSLILIHPANNAQKELKGCIAPVSKLTGTGEGVNSRIACANLLAKIYPAMDTQTVYLIIKTNRQ
jgi:hypothetical protein